MILLILLGILIGTIAVVSVATKFPITIGDDEY
jgi:hypothetical protein